MSSFDKVIIRKTLPDNTVDTISRQKCTIFLTSTSRMVRILSNSADAIVFIIGIALLPYSLKDFKPWFVQWISWKLYMYIAFRWSMHRCLDCWMYSCVTRVDYSGNEANCLHILKYSYILFKLVSNHLSHFIVGVDQGLSDVTILTKIENSTDTEVDLKSTSCEVHVHLDSKYLRCIGLHNIHVEWRRLNRTIS